MANALRELFVVFDIEVETGKLEEAHGKVDGLKKNVELLGEGFEKLKVVAEAALAGLAIEKVAEMTEELAKEALQLDATASAVGVSADELEHWQDVAEATGQSGEGVAYMFKTLSRSAYEASTGSKEASKAFKELGVDVGKGENLKSGSELINEVTEALAGIENPAKRAALAQATLGRGALTLLPALSRGKEGLEELSHVLEENGPAFDENFIQMSREAAIDTFKWERAIKQLKVAIAKNFLPVLEAFEGMVVKILQPISDYLKVQGNVNTLLLAAATVALPALISTLGGLAGVLRILRILAVEAFLPFFAVAGVIALIQDFYVFLKGGDSLIGAFFNKIGGPGGAQMIRKELLDAFERIKAKGVELWEILKYYAGEFMTAIRPIIDAFNEWHGDAEDLKLVIDALALAFGALIGAKIAGGLSAIAGGLQAMVAFNPALTALAAALLAVYAAWRQLEQFSAETGGLGVIGTVQEMYKQGTLNPFKAVDAYQNAKARAEAANPDTTTVQPAGSVFGPPEAYVPRPFNATDANTKTLIDQRTTNINVGGSASPGQTARAVRDQVSSAQANDRAAILAAVK